MQRSPPSLYSSPALWGNLDTRHGDGWAVVSIAGYVGAACCLIAALVLSLAASLGGDARTKRLAAYPLALVIVVALIGFVVFLVALSSFDSNS